MSLSETNNPSAILIDAILLKQITSYSEYGKESPSIEDRQSDVIAGKYNCKRQKKLWNILPKPL